MDAEDGTLTINTANAYTGGTELLKGSIAANHAQALGTGSITMATGTGLMLGNSVTLANGISMTGDGIFTVSGDGTATLNGLLSDTAEGSAGKFVKSGDGMLVLGNASNTYTGGTQITGGALSFDYAARAALGTGGVEVGRNGTLLYAVNAGGGKTTSLFSNTVQGTGTIILDNTGQDETNINNAVFAGFGGELVLRGSLRFYGETGSNLASVRTITVESGTHLYMDNESMAGSPWTQDFTIAGTGTGTGNDKAGALRMDKTTISGDLTLSADASIIVFIAGTSTISGNLIGGDHILTFNPNNNANRKLVLSGASVAAGGIGSTRAGTLILGGGTGEDNQNTVAELGAAGLNLNANTVLELNNATIRAMEQWAQSVGSNTVTLMDGTTNTIDTNGTNITFTGNVGGEGSLVKDGDGTLSIGAGSNYTGQTTVSGGILNMNGAALAGDISLGYGSMANAQNATGNVSIRQDTPGREPSSVSLGGMSGSKLNSYHGSASRTGDQATRVTDIGGGNISLSNSTLGISSDMVGGGSGEVFSFSTAADGSVTLSGNLLLQLTDAAAAELLDNLNNTPLINITNGTLTLGDGTTVSFDTPYNIYGSFFDSSVTSNGGALVLQPKEGGSDWLIQNENDPPLTFNDTNKTIMESMAGIHNNGVINIDITGTENMQLKNLEGVLSSAMINTGTNEGLTLVLVNAGDITDSTYQGSIEGDAAIRKEGAGYAMNIGGNVRTSSLDVVEGTLSIGGKLTTAQATVMEDGKLVLNGTGSSIDALNITGGKLTLGEKATVSVNSLTASQKGTVYLDSGSELTLLSSTALGAAVTGSGTFAVSGAGNIFSLAQDGSIGNDTTLALRDGASTTVDGVLSLGGLAGDGTVDLNGGVLELHNASAVFSGAFRNAGSIRMNGTGSQTLAGPGSADVNLGITQGTLVLRGNGVTYGHVVVGNVGTLSLVSDNGMPHLHTIKGFFMGDGSTLNIHMNAASSSDLGTAVSSAGTVIVGDASINLYNDASSSFNAEDRTLDLVLMEGAGGTTATLGSGYKLTAGFLSLLYNLRLEAQGSNIVLLGDERTDSPYLAASTTHNSLAGGSLLNESKWIIAGDKTSNLYLISDSIARDMENGNMASATRKLAAVAGSTVNALGTAQRDALREQMGWIRNRTNQMGVN
ncbi:MAG: autotransporter-associated beta strand repeat-containing protein, partial [Akkermansiaceae bacterium]|nr:autotransporter-associated beta strand repeat-containing protein [Akkermansiaceae bacterium]